MRPVLWTPQAVADLDGLPAPVRERILERVELLSEFPLMGSPMDGPYDGFRQLLVGRYRVVYQATAADVRIGYVRHGARQLGLRLLRGGAR